MIKLVHDNIAKNRKPLAGIVTEGGTTVPPAAQLGLEAALTKAAGIVNQARVLQLAMDKAEAEIARQEALAKKNLDQAFRVAVLKGPLYKRLFRLSDVAKDVTTQTGVVNARAGGAAQAYAALQSAAVEANSNAGIICAHVSQTVTAAQARLWQHEAAKQIAEVAAALQNAQSDVQALDGSANVLRASDRKSVV